MLREDGLAEQSSLIPCREERRYLKILAWIVAVLLHRQGSNNRYSTPASKVPLRSLYSSTLLSRRPLPSLYVWLCQGHKEKDREVQTLY